MKQLVIQNTTILIQRLEKMILTILIKWFGETSGKLQILSKKKEHEDIASKLHGI